MKNTFLTFTAIGMLAASAAFSGNLENPWKRPEVLAPKGPGLHWCEAQTRYTSRKHAKSADCKNDENEKHDRPEVECTFNLWSEGGVYAKNGGKNKPEKECA